MTEKEANQILHCPDTVGGVYSEKYGQALGIAMKALEKESVLDKIKAETESPNRGTCDYFIVDRIEEIINKYKAEMEVEE